MWLNYCWLVWVGLTTHLALNPHAQSCGCLFCSHVFKVMFDFSLTSCYGELWRKNTTTPTSYVWCCKCELSIGQTVKKKRGKNPCRRPNKLGQHAKIWTAKFWEFPRHFTPFLYFEKNVVRSFTKQRVIQINSQKTEEMQFICWKQKKNVLKSTFYV